MKYYTRFSTGSGVGCLLSSWMVPCGSSGVRTAFDPHVPGGLESKPRLQSDKGAHAGAPAVPTVLSSLTPTSPNSMSVNAAGRRFGPPTGQKFLPSLRPRLHDNISRAALLDKAAGAVKGAAIVNCQVGFIGN